MGHAIPLVLLIARAPLANVTPRPRHLHPSLLLGLRRAEQPVAPPQPIIFTPGTDPAQLMQAFFSGLAQFTSQASAAGQTAQDPFISALREFERHHTPRYDGNGGYDATEEWLATVQVTF
jgi:hypothetical protein